MINNCSVWGGGGGAPKGFGRPCHAIKRHKILKNCLQNIIQIIGRTDRLTMTMKCFSSRLTFTLGWALGMRNSLQTDEDEEDVVKAGCDWPSHPYIVHGGWQTPRFVSSAADQSDSEFFSFQSSTFPNVSNDISSFERNTVEFRWTPLPPSFCNRKGHPSPRASSAAGFAANVSG